MLYKSCPLQKWGLKMWMITLSNVVLFIKVKYDCKAITLIFFCLWLKFALRAKVFWALDVSIISEESYLSHLLEPWGPGRMWVPAQGSMFPSLGPAPPQGQPSAP